MFDKVLHHLRQHLAKVPTGSLVMDYQGFEKLKDSLHGAYEYDELLSTLKQRGSIIQYYQVEFIA